MNQRQRFIRKVAYAVAIAVLLLPLSWLSQPATTESEGGVLARMRSEHQLGQADLGEIDPASETIKLATLGLQCVAFNILWQKADHYQKVEDWASRSATLEQMTKLEPHYVSVWVYQGWNLTYNISVQFDDYHDRYYWVIKGIDYLKEGTRYNKDEPLLLYEIGWTTAQKLGRADEHVQYRRLFREDDDFNGARPLAQRDNWLVGREWLVRAQEMADRGYPVKGKNPLLFHSHPVMCLMNYAEALEEEGTFGEVAKNAWRKAAEGWTEFSNRDLPTLHNVAIRLSDLELWRAKSQEAQAELAKWTPDGLRSTIFQEKKAKLTPEQLKAYEATNKDRTPEQAGMMHEIDAMLEISHIEVANRISNEHRAEALKAAEAATYADFMIRTIDTERDTVNYDYWLARAQIEPEDVTLAARKFVYDGDRALEAAQLVKASELYTEGLNKWRMVLDAHPNLLKDSNLTDELVDAIIRYRKALAQLDEKLPSPFILQDVIDADSLYHGPRILGANSNAPKSTPDDEESRPAP